MAKAESSKQSKKKALQRIGPNLYASERKLVYRRQIPADLRKVLGRREVKVWLGSAAAITIDRAKKAVAELDTEQTALFKLIRKRGALPEFLAREAEVRADLQERLREAELAYFAQPRDAQSYGELFAVERGIRQEAAREAKLWRRAQARDLEAKLPESAREKYGDAAGVVERRVRLDASIRLLTAALAVPPKETESESEEIQAIADERKLRRELAAAQAEMSELDAIIGPSAPMRAKVKASECVTGLEATRRKSENLTEITTRKYDLYMRHFTELFGDIPVKDITYRHVDDYVDAVRGLPNANYLSPAERKTLKVEELLELRADKDIGAVGRETVVKHVDWLKALLNYAEKKRIIASNPARSVDIPKSESRRYADKRRPFTPSQLVEVLAKAEEVWADDPRLWYLRLCIFSGVRPDEGAQLDVFDVKKEREVSYVEIHDIGKTIKNRSSVRKVPLHPRLLELGFLDFVAGREKGRLFGFPRTAKGEHEFATRNLRPAILKGCPSCLDANGEPDRRLVWYSFRHSFADACRNGGVRDSARRQLMGHVEQGAPGEYGEGLSIATLAKEIAKADPLSDLALASSA